MQSSAVAKELIGYGEAQVVTLVVGGNGGVTVTEQLGVEVTQLLPGPLEVGARFRYRARFAGRQFELVWEVTAYELNRRQAVKTISGPLRWGGTRTFQAIPGGTRITFSGGGRAGGFFGLAEPLLLRAAQRSLRSDLGHP